jgi:hypothetical protein
MVRYIYIYIWKYMQQVNQLINVTCTCKKFTGDVLKGYFVSSNNTLCLIC